jgi:pimeloyl-ACP methyl ester carboxylesterase
MDQSTLIELRRARDLLQAGEREEARLILARILKQDPGVEHAWYLLSFTIEDPQKQRYALNQALRINPAYKKARARLVSLSEASEQVPPGQSKDPAARAGPAREAPGVETKPHLQKPAARRQKRRISPVLLILALSGLCVILIFGAGAAYLLMDSSLLANLMPAPRAPAAQAGANPSPTPSPTASPTPPPTATPTWTPTPTLEAFKPTFIPASCNFHVTRETRVDCGYVLVPEKRDAESTHTIRLAVAVYHSTSDRPAAEPVIYLHGGPGGEAIQPLALVYDSFIAPILKERDLIAFDQRGSGLSSPSLACPEMDSVYLRQGISDDERKTLSISAFQACHDRLAYSEVNLDAYTSAASGTDVRDILVALGYPRAILYGVSYGTRLALTVMRDHPEIVHSAVLDSSLPLETKFFNELTTKTDYAFNELFSGCAADSECNKAYHGLDKVFYDLVTKFDAQPVTVKVKDLVSGQSAEVKVDGNELVSAIDLGLFSSELIPILPQAIYTASNGDYTLLGALLSLSKNVYTQISMGAYISINCHEQVYATTSEQLETDLAAYPKLDSFARAAIYGSPETLFSICNLWGAAAYDPIDSQPVHSAIPSLILAGEYDPATPPFFGKQLLDDLSVSYYVEFPASGHAVSMDAQDSCPLDVVLAFLADPYQPPNTTCVAGLQRPQFITVPISSAP